MSSGTNNLEEIKLVVENVKFKKIEGALYLMSERIAWMQKQKSTFAISHHYVDIKTQKISTEGKAKVQLQVVLHDDSSSTFHFVSPQGPEQQVKDRDQVKDLLSNLLPKFRQKISKELEEKKRILIENPVIYQLYNELVVNQIVTAEDFWKNYVDMNKLKQEPNSQLTGVSQGFMSNITPKSDGSSGLVYNISYDDIQSIFKTYPAVKLKYIQNVPNKMSEKDFWTKFFQSYYFRRDQITTSANDLFADCSLKDDEDLRNKAQKFLDDPYSVIETNRDLTSEDGFGLTDFSTSKTSNLSNQNLIKRYNYYSMRVLSSMDEQSAKEEAQKPSSTTIGASRAKRARLDEEIKELEKDGLNELRGAFLNLTHKDRYFFGPKTNETQVYCDNLRDKSVEEEYRNCLNQMKDWNINMQKISNPATAISVLVELSPGSQLMQSNAVQNLKEEIPKSIQEEIKYIYQTAIQMLKAFHGIFPPKNNEQEQKIKTIKENLETFYQQKISTLSDKLQKEHVSWNLTMNLENMFRISISKYNTWQMKMIS